MRDLEAVKRIGKQSMENIPLLFASLMSRLGAKNSQVG